MSTATFTEKTQDWDNGKTVYWFEVTIDGEFGLDGLYGVVESGCDDQSLVDCDGIPCDSNVSWVAAHIDLCEVTDEMRMD